jgi:Membrane-associating domain
MLFGIIVFSISVSLARGQQIGNAPATTIYDAFAGGIAMVACPLGMTALGVTSLVPISLVVDGLVTVALLAGGIATAVELRGTDCGNIFTLYYNNLLNGGLLITDGQTIWLLSNQQIMARCNADKASTAFMFIGLVVSAALLVLGFLFHKRAK